MIARTLKSQKQNGSLGPVRRRALHNIRPAPENERLYRPVDPNDPEIQALAESIRQHGLREPIVITADGYILSGHRRHCACKLAGLKLVPVRIDPIRREDDIDKFVRLLRESNLQRDKTLAEKLNEELVTVNPEEAYVALLRHRDERAYFSPAPGELKLNGRRKRSSISKAKEPLLQRVQAVLADLREFLPISLRAIHYNVLNDPPLIHASKPDSLYRNDKDSYKKLSDLCSRGRIEGLIPWEAICDETRATTSYRVHDDCRTFIRDELNGFLKLYWRNLMVSQPNHVEIVGEKNTIHKTLYDVASEYTIPLTCGRGFSSVTKQWEMAERFRRSGKDTLTLIVVSDFDPSGEAIAHSFAQNMRDDHGIETIAIKSALRQDQVHEMDLHTDFTAKRSDSRYEEFVEKYGEDVYELEAVNPGRLQESLRETIDSVINAEAFNAELDAEREDAAFLEGVRRRVHDALKGIGDGL